MLAPTLRSAAAGASRRRCIAQPLSSWLSTSSSGSPPPTSTKASQRRAASTLLKLNTGQNIPAIGFGTWQDVSAQESAVSSALKAGYRHIDTARVYGTEQAVGSALRSSDLQRGEVFVTTKLWNNAHHPEDVEAALDASLADLGTDYVDLYLMHWPVAWARGKELRPKDAAGKVKPGETDFVETYRAMEELMAKGKARAIGVSNFSRGEMERLLQKTSVVPAAHQFEVHPYLQQREFCAWHRERGILVTQYSPLGNQNEIYDKGNSIGKLIEEPLLKSIGKKHGKSGAQVALAWGIALGHSVIPKSKTPARIRENLEADFKLDTSDVEQIADLDRQLRFNNPKGWGWEFYSDLEGK